VITGRIKELLVTSYGQKGTLSLILPGILMAVILFFYLSTLTPRSRLLTEKPRRKSKRPFPEIN
jgi:hypothetical protein